jgi:hypothetical protein
MMPLALKADGIGDFVSLSGALPVVIRENLGFGFRHGDSG